MKILVNNELRRDKIDGCVLYRNIIPFEALAGMGHEIEGLPLQRKFEHEVGWFNRMYGPGIKDIVPLYRYGGAKILFECDDLLDSTTSDNPFRAGDFKQSLVGYHYLLDHADVITTTTEYLKTEMQKRTQKPIVVIPNAMREFLLRPCTTKRIKIGYGGGISHYKDLDFILDVIIELQKTLDFDFTTIGIGPDNSMEAYKDYPYIYNSVKSVLDKLKKVRNYTYVPFAEPWLYQKTLSDLDLTIGVCPLQDSIFSRCKSAIKFYEYASVGTVTLAQDIVTYEDCNYTAKRFSEWKNKLSRLITDETFRNEILGQQMEYVKKERTIDTVKYAWDKTIRSLVAETI